MRGARLAAGFVCGLAAAAALALLMAPTGGLPSRPRFLSVGVADVADVTDGSITGGGDGLLLRSSLGASSILVDDSGAIFELAAGDVISANRGALDAGVPIQKIGFGPFSGADLLPGESVLVLKDADTARASVTALADDDDLQATGLPAGHYRVETFLQFTDAGGGVSFRPDAPVSVRLHGVRNCGGNAVVAATQAAANSCATGNNYFGTFDGVTSAAMTTGDIAIMWAQDTSNAGATVLETESWLRVTRLQ